MNTISLSATFRFPKDATRYKRRLVAWDMVSRGEHFVVSAMLLRRHGGDAYVWRHNLCQGMEVMLKGSLLVRDFDGYWPRMRRLGHKLLSLADEAAQAYGFAPPAGALRQELSKLDFF